MTHPKAGRTPTGARRASAPRPAERPPHLPGGWEELADLSRVDGPPGLLELLADVLRGVTGVSLYVVDPNGVVIVWTEGAARLYGHAAAAVLGRVTLGDLSASVAGEPTWREMLNEALVAGEWSGVSTRVHRDGRRFMVRGVVTPVRRRPSGGLIGFVIVSRDVSAQMRQFEALETDVFRSHTIIDTSPLPLAITTLSGVIEVVNPAMEGLCGQTRSSLVGSPLSRLLTEPDRAADLISQTMQDELVHAFPVEVRARRGDPVPATCHAVAFLDEDRSPRGAILRFADRRPADQLRRQREAAEATASAVADAAADGLMTIDATGVIAEVSDGLCQSCGLLRQELSGERFAQRFTDPQAAQALAEQAFTQPGRHRARLELLAGDGRARPVAVTAWAGPDSTTMFAVVADLTAAEAAARERAVLGDLTEAAGEGLALVDLRGVVARANRRLGELLGMAPGTTEGAEFSRCFAEPRLATEAIQRGLADGQAAGYELHPAGNGPSTLSVATASRGLDAAVRGVVAAVRDITPQAQLQAALDQERGYARALVEGSPEPLLAVSPDGLISDVNDLAATLTGQTRRRLVGRELSRLFADGEAVRRRVSQVLSGARVRGQEFALTGPAAGRSVSVSAAAFHDPDGRPLGALVAMRDVTGQHAVEERLRAQELYSRSLIEASADALMITDLGGRIIDVNRAGEELRRKSREDLIGTHATENALDPDGVAELISLALRDGRVTDYQIVATLPGAGTAVMSCNASVVTGSDGRRQALLLAARDVTERHRLEETQRGLLAEARRLDSAKTDFVARISHELRSPLSSVLGYLELLRVGRAGPLSAEQQRLLANMARNGDRLRAQVADLLMLSRIEAGNMQVNRTEVGLAPLVAQVYEELLPAIDAKRLDCRLDLAEDVMLDADAAQLEQAVSNLLGNAVKFTPEGGRITVTTRREAAAAVISVEDTGVGVPTDEIPHLFDRFFRSSTSVAREIRGTGLGLFIVRQIARAHGGDVFAESAPGRGSMFVLRLPLHATEGVTS